MTTENRRTPPDWPERRPVIPAWTRGNAQRRALDARLRALRRRVVVASLFGTLGFSALAGYHTATASTAAATTTGQPTSSTTQSSGQSPLAGQSSGVTVTATTPAATATTAPAAASTTAATATSTAAATATATTAPTATATATSVPTSTSRHTTTSPSH